MINYLISLEKSFVFISDCEIALSLVCKVTPGWHLGDHLIKPILFHFSFSHSTETHFKRTNVDYLFAVESVYTVKKHSHMIEL